MRTIRTPKKREAFLAALAKGTSVTGACAAARVSKDAIYSWRQDDLVFAADWETALEAGTDLLEDEALRRACRGTEKPVFHKGVQCGVIREYSDTLLIFTLKARRPDKYRENMTIRGDDGQMADLVDAIRRS